MTPNHDNLDWLVNPILKISREIVDGEDEFIKSGREFSDHERGNLFSEIFEQSLPNDIDKTYPMEYLITLCDLAIAYRENTFGEDKIANSEKEFIELVIQYCNPAALNSWFGIENSWGPGIYIFGYRDYDGTIDDTYTQFLDNLKDCIAADRSEN